MGRSTNRNRRNVANHFDFEHLPGRKYDLFWDPEGWLNPFSSTNVGTVLAQFAVALAALIALNRWLASSVRPLAADEETR